MQIRYEDLAASPQMEMDRVFQFLGLDKEEVVSAPRFPQKNHLIENEMLLYGEVVSAKRWPNRSLTF